MSEQRPSMFVPALIGGRVAGVLSAIPFINCLCCLWIIGGAMLAAHLLAKDSVVPLNAGDGGSRCLDGLDRHIRRHHCEHPLYGHEQRVHAEHHGPVRRVRR